MVSHEHKCIFIHIPKCAGTSIERSLGHFDKYSGRGRQDHRSIRVLEQPFLTPDLFSTRENIIEGMRRVKYFFNNSQNPANDITVTNQQYRDYFKFTFIRNPWSRAYSWYRGVMRDEIHKKELDIQGELKFKEFLARYIGTGLLLPQTYWLKKFDGSISLDFIGRFENLKDDFSYITNQLGIPELTLPHETKGSGDSYIDHYDENSVQMVAEFYKDEIEMFGYSFKP